MDVAIIGAGTAGSHAVSQARRAGKSFVLINGGPLGTTCARVGCMPSKMLIHAADLFHERHMFDELGIRGAGELRADIPAALRRVRALRDDLVAIATDRIIGALAPEQLIDGYARLAAPDVVEAAGQRIRAGRIIIATGSRPVLPGSWRRFGHLLLTTDELFEQEDLPPRMAVIGLGAIGLEMGQALRRLGIEVTGFDALERIGGIVDPAIHEDAMTLFSRELPMYLGHEAELEAAEGGLRVSAGDHDVVVDKVLVSVGRRPNVDGLGLEGVGAPVDEDGRLCFDPRTMQVGDLPIFLAGDATGERLILHEAADEGRIAGFNASRGEYMPHRRKTPLSIVFTDPNIISVGARWDELDADAVAVGEADFDGQGRARIMGKNRGRVRVYGDRASGRVLGAAMCVPGGEHLGHLVAWSIEQGLTAFDLQKMPYYHPVLEEGLGQAVDMLARRVNARPGPGLPHVRLARD